MPDSHTESQLPTRWQRFKRWLTGACPVCGSTETVTVGGCEPYWGEFTMQKCSWEGKHEPRT